MNTVDSALSAGLFQVSLIKQSRFKLTSLSVYSDYLKVSLALEYACEENGILKF
jgi:hypothetical protein